MTIADPCTSSPRECQSAIHLLLVDDHTVVREALAVLIERHDGLVVMAQAAVPGDVKPGEPDPDVVVTELGPSSGGSGNVEDLRKRFPRSGVLVLTNVAYPAKVQAALADGADGYLLKTATVAELMSGLQAVARGESFLQPSLGAALARWHGPRRGHELSAAEEQILVLVATGHTNTDIASRLKVSPRTVETHRARIRQKLGRTSRASLFEFALDAGLIQTQ